MNRFLAILIGIAGLAALLGILAFVRSDFGPVVVLENASAPVPPRAILPAEPVGARLPQPPSSQIQAAHPPGEEPPISARLTAMGDRLADRQVRREACRLAVLWFQADPASVWEWIQGQAGDARFDPVMASVAQSCLAQGDFDAAQDLAEIIIDPATRGWLHEEAWTVALERGQATPERLRDAGLSPEAIQAILGGNRRD